MEVAEGPPKVFRKGYREVPVNGDAVDLKTDCGIGDIVWWRTQSGNLYQLDIKGRVRTEGILVGSLRDERKYSSKPAPVSEVWGCVNEDLSLGKIEKGKTVMYGVREKDPKNKSVPKGLFESSRVEDFGLLRKEPGLFSRFFKIGFEVR